MKSKIIMVIAVIAMMMIGSSNFAKAETNQNNNNNCINILTVKWDAAWYYFCLGGSGTVCSITIKICFPFNLTAATSILGRTLNANETPILITATQGEFDSVQDLQSVDITEHIFTQNSPKIIEGALNQTMTIPAQSLIYSQQYQGFIGYCILQ
ncbi:MAG: hypothetical protein ACPL1A_10085 [Candidatus Kapaibacteriota bacterium]